MKRASMAEALSQAARRPAAKKSTIAQDEPVPLIVRRIQASVPSREGKKPITAFFLPEVSRQLKKLALDQDKTIQELVRESLNDLFHKYDQPPIA